jgi:hypothetical protein
MQDVECRMQDVELCGMQNAGRRMNDCASDIPHPTFGI